MSGSNFTACDRLFSFGCSGEVVMLVQVAERYGTLIEKAGTRIETLCKECRNLRLQARRHGEDEKE